MAHVGVGVAVDVVVVLAVGLAAVEGGRVRCRFFQDGGVRVRGRQGVLDLLAREQHPLQ